MSLLSFLPWNCEPKQETEGSHLTIPSAAIRRFHLAASNESSALPRQQLSIVTIVSRTNCSSSSTNHRLIGVVCHTPVTRQREKPSSSRGDFF